MSQLSLVARACNHAKTTYRYRQPVNRQDDFIVSCGQNARFAIGICEEHIYNLRKRAAHNRFVNEPNSRCSIANDILVALDSNNHLYIYGDPGLDKTELANCFLRDKKFWKAGEPSNFFIWNFI